LNAPGTLSVNCGTPPANVTVAKAIIATQVAALHLPTP
jgi:hypothetical protein